MPWDSHLALPNLLFCQRCHSNTFQFSMLLALPGWWRRCWDCHGKSVFLWRTKAICTLRKLSSYLLQKCWAMPAQIFLLWCWRKAITAASWAAILSWMLKLLKKILLAEHLCNISATKICFHPQILRTLFEGWMCYKQTHLRGQETIQLWGLARVLF